MKAGANVLRTDEKGQTPLHKVSLVWTHSLLQISTSAANRLIGEVVQSQRRPLLGPSPG